MSRQQGSSSGRGRGSLGGSTEQTSVKSLLLACNNQLESLSQKVDRDCSKHGIPPDTLKEWKDQLMQLSRDSASLDNALVVTKTAIQVELDSLAVKGSSSSSSATSSSSAAKNGDEENDTAAAIAQRINLKIKASQKEFNVSEAKIVKTICQKFADSNEDEDIVLVNEELNEATFTCPVTAMKIVEPMTNGLCPHAVSRAGINSMMKATNQCSCPMPGCSSKWTRSNTQPDPVFQDKMDRFYRKQSQATAFATANHVGDAIALDDDEEVDL